jgi:hypothetical protein
MSDTIQISGTVKTVLPVEDFPSGFRKRVLVINTGGDYPQTIPVEFTKDKVDVLTGLRKGQEVTAHVNLRGSEYNGKYYANIQGWKLDKGDAQSGQSTPTTRKMHGSEPSAGHVGNTDDDSALPF